MKYKFEIDKRLMGLNEYTNLNRKNRYLGNQAKQKEQVYIMWCIKEQLGNLKLDNPVIRTLYLDRRKQEARFR